MNNKGLHKTYTFNENGNEESVTNLTEEEQLNDGYGASASYLSNIAIQYDEYKKLNNKLSGNVDMVKYVKNYLNNSSFEESNTIFETDNETVLISHAYANPGSKRLKIISNNSKVTAKEIASVCGITEDGVAYHIKKLKQSGRLIRIGGSRNGGEWRVVE